MLPGDYDAGIALHQWFLEKEPENGLALYHLGFALGQKEDHLQELPCYERAIALGFEEEGVFFNPGMAYGVESDRKGHSCVQEGLGNIA